MGVGLRGRARAGGIAHGGPVLCFFGVSEFESSWLRGEKNFSVFFFFLAKVYFSQGGIGKKYFFRLIL